MGPDGYINPYDNVRNTSNIDLVHCTIGLEELAKVMIRHTKPKIPDKDIHAHILLN